MQAYISISFSKRKELEKEVQTIKKTLENYGISSLVFVDEHQFSANEEETIMNRAMKDIDNSDFVIAEVSEKGIGIGVEVGYAKAKNKPIVYLKSSKSEHSTTISGISDFRIFYENNDNLEEKLSKSSGKI